MAKFKKQKVLMPVLLLQFYDQKYVLQILDKILYKLIIVDKGKIGYLAKKKFNLSMYLVILLQRVT